MPTLPEDGVAQPPVVGGDAALLPQAHKYSANTFRTVLTAIRFMAVYATVRDAFKAHEATYLHLRGLAFGSIRGFSKENQTFAIDCLRDFIDDSSKERAMVSSNVNGVNKAMASYWRGHIHKLYCETCAGPVDGMGPVSGIAGAIQSTIAKHRRQCRNGAFLDGTNLETMNKYSKKRLLQARKYSGGEKNP